MSNFRTIALIFAVGLIANILHGLFFGIDEQIDTTPPDPVDAHNLKSETQEQLISEEEDLFDEHSELIEDDDSYFDEIIDPEGYHHKHGKNLIYLS